MEDAVDDSAGSEVTDTLLYGRHVELIPFKDSADWEYLFDLAEMDEGRYATRDQIAEEIMKYGILFWIIEYRGIRSGVGLCLKVNDHYIMEALKDKRVSGTSIRHSIESGQLMLDQIFGLTDIVQTCARKEDIGIQILCKKLGFKNVGIVESGYGPLVLFQKEKI